MTSIRKRDLTQGKLLPQIILFALPVMATGLLQMMFNATDTVMVGRWGGATPEECETALAAVGSCGSLIAMIVNFFTGLSVGSSVCAAQSIGAKRHGDVQKVVHTSALTSLVCGILVMLIGIFFARPFLAVMGTDPLVIDQAVQYMRAYFAGAPASLIYCYLAAVLRADGDSRTPLIFLTVSGAANVALNAVMIIVFKMGALGVGIATAISQWLSCFMVIIHMLRLKDFCRLDLRQLKFHKETFLRIIRIGIPAGAQGLVSSFANVLTQAAINSFGKVVVAAFSSAANVCNFIYIIENAFTQATVTFVGQNVGARRYERVKSIVKISVLSAAVVGITLGVIVLIFSEPLLGIYMPDNPMGIHYGNIHNYCVASIYFICGIMDIGSGFLRGMGKSLTASVVFVIGTCVLRVLWIYTVFAHFFPLLSPEHSLAVLFLSYPITWIFTAVISFALGFRTLRGKIRELSEEETAKQSDGTPTEA